MKNRIASLFLVFALLMSLCVSAGARDNRIIVQSGGAERFTDVPTSHWAYAYINKVVGSGLFNGRTPTTFEPSNAMTRSQFVMVMARMEGRSDLEGVETQTIFPDVTSTRRAAGPIAWATEQGFVQGFGDGTFKPDSPITRGQFAALIHRYIIAKRYVDLNELDPEPAQFTDAASVSSAFTNDVEYARVHGLLTGYSDGTVRSGNPITRAAIAAILARFLDLVSESGYTPLLDGPVIDGGDSGNTTEPPVDVPTSYDDIKLKVNGSTHGKTTLVATRNGETVAADDLQPGDRVTVTHTPDSGYSVSIRIKDKGNKTVTKHTSGFTTWFEVPSNLPVTVTVTYSKESSGGGGGGSSGSSGSSGYYDPGTTQQQDVTYYAMAEVKVDPAGNGYVFLSKNAPTTATEEPTIPVTADELSRMNNSSIPGYAVFVPNEGYELDTSEGAITAVSSVATDTVTLGTPTPVTLSNGKAATYVSFTAKGYLKNSEPTITVTGHFKSKGGGDDTEEKVTWTIRWNVDGGFISVAKTDTFSALTAPLTSNPYGSAGVTIPNLDKGSKQTLYVALSPDTANHFIPADPNLTRKDGDGDETKPTATALLENRLFVYEITLENISADTTTVLNGAFAPDPVAARYDVTVLPVKYYNAETQQVEDPSADMALLNPYAAIDSGKGPQVIFSAEATDVVTVYVPLTTGYQVHDVTVTGKSATYTATPNENPADPAILEYTFKMPNEAVNIQVTFEDVPDPELTYTVNVVFANNGKGTMTLNVGGTDYQFKDGEPASITHEIKTSEYEKYADTLIGTPSQLTDAQRQAHALPVYLVGEVVPASGYKFDSLTGDVTTANTKDRPSYALTPSNAITVTANFTQELSFGYNLTIIGKANLVVVELNGTTRRYSNNTTGKKTERYSAFFNNATNGQVNVAVTEVSAGTGYEFDADVLINDQSRELGAPYSMSTGMVDIVVALRDRNATPVVFTVTNADTNGNTVTVRGEGSKLYRGTSSGNTDTDRDRIRSGSTTVVVPDEDNTATSQTFMTYSGTTVTLIPNPIEVKDAQGNVQYKYKVSEITVNGDKDISDEQAYNGFSYTIQGGENIEVKFDRFEQYRFRVQAPYQANLSMLDLHSSSRQISGTNTLQEVLYSLNNGQRYNKDDYTPDPNPLNLIQNNIASTLGNVSKILYVYLTTSKTGDDGQPTTPAKELGKTLQDSVQASISQNLDQMIEAEKNKMVKPTDADGNDSALMTQIKSSIGSALSGVSYDPVTQPLNDDIKGQIIKEILAQAQNKDLQTYYNNGTIKFDNFNITSASVTPLVTIADEAGIGKAAGKSVESQMPNLITDYLTNYLKIGPVSNVTANVNLVPEETDSTADSDGTTLITISATANFDPNNLPTLAPDVTFAGYVNPTDGTSKLSVWVKTTVTVSLQSTPDTTLPSDIHFDPVTRTDAFSLSQVGANISLDSINNTLGNVNSTINTEWGKKWDTTRSDSLVKPGTQDGRSVVVLEVSMGDVLTKDMLDIVIEGDDSNPENDSILGSVLDTLTTNVKSLGGKEKATATKAAFQNIYRDFVVFNQGDPDRLITLKTNHKLANGDPDTSKYPVLGKIDGNNLVLMLGTDKLEEFFRDVNPASDATSFEKLIDLMTALRDGMSTDIRNNSTANETAQSVLAGLIRGQIGKKGQLIATKWGTVISSNGQGADRRMTDVEREELADLTAELIMRPLKTTSMDEAWKPFEDKGYRSVSLSVGLDRLNDQVQTALKKFNTGSEFSKVADLNAGFRMDQKLAGDN